MGFPIYVTCRDRLGPLKQLVQWFSARGLLGDVTLFDNDSTYEPLLAFYPESGVRVVRLGRNLLSHAFWGSGECDRIGDRPFILAEDDIVPEDTVPEDWQARFAHLLGKYPEQPKVGFSLRLDDLPDHYAFKQEVLELECNYWKRDVEPGVYDAVIDTAMALYRPGQRHTYGGLRVAPPYTARHLMWYEDTDNPPPDLRHYLTRDELHWSTWSTKMRKRLTGWDAVAPATRSETHGPAAPM